MAGFVAGSVLKANSYVKSAQLNSDVVRLADGRLVMAWTSKKAPNGEDNDNFSVRLRLFDEDGVPLADDENANDVNQENYQVFKDIIALDDGGFVVSWVHADDTTNTGSPENAGLNDIYVQRFDSSGNEVGEEFIISTTSNDVDGISHVSPALTATSTGFMVAFQKDDDLFTRTFDTTSPTTTVAGTETQINTAAAADTIKDPDITTLSDGSYVVTWDEQVGGNWDVYGQIYDAAGNPLGSEITINSTTNNTQGDAKIEALDGGGFVVVWEGKKIDSNNNGIAGQVFDKDGNPVGAEFQANTYETKSQQDPDVAALDGGGFVIVWRSANQDADGTHGVYGQAYHPNGDPLGTEFEIGHDAGDSESAPEVEATADGGFVVTWTGKHTTGNDITYRVFTPDGTPQTGGGSGGDDTTAGGGGNDTLDGGDGNDVLFGYGGDDVLSGGIGDDTVSGQNGADSISGNDGADVLGGGDGDDSLDGGVGYDSLDGGDGADTLNGGAGYDVADYSNDNVGVYVNFTTGVANNGQAQGDQFVSVEDAEGGEGDDTIIGDGTYNYLYGNAGNDSLMGEAGGDIVDGGDGNDFLDGGDDIDFVWGGAGDDTVSGGGGNDELWGGSGADFLDGGTGVDFADYSDAAGSVTIDLGAGTGSGSDATGDTLANIENVWGGDSDDVLIGDGNDNELWGEFSYNGTTGDGAADNDTLSGAGGSDTLFGLGGDDVLNGGAGADTLSGGNGADVIEYAAGDGADVVNDFDLSEDLLDLDAGLGISTQTDLDNVKSDTGGNALLDFGSGDTITLMGVDEADLLISHII